MMYDIYFSIIGLVWLSIWASVYWSLCQHDFAGSFLGSNRRAKVLILGVVCGVVPIGYLTSFAPFLHYQQSLSPSLRVLQDLYVPVQWGIDHTWLRHPLVWWAAIWNVDHQVITASAERLNYGGVWGTTPPWLYAMFWLALGATLSFAPPYLLRVTLKKLRVSTIKLRQALPH